MQHQTKTLVVPSLLDHDSDVWYDCYDWDRPGDGVGGRTYIRYNSYEEWLEATESESA